jgi:hypothetical protein
MPSPPEHHLHVDIAGERTINRAPSTDYCYEETGPLRTGNLHECRQNPVALARTFLPRLKLSRSAKGIQAKAQKQRSPATKITCKGV